MRMPWASLRWRTTPSDEMPASGPTEVTPFEGVRGSRRWHAVTGGMQHGTIPWVSALHGGVIGGGMDLAAASHIRVSDRSAFFALPEGQRGIFVGGGGSVRARRGLGLHPDMAQPDILQETRESV